MAKEIAENYWSRPEVIVYSEDRLALDGVTEAETRGPDQIYRWRYSGMHLLDRVNGTYFLMPADWADAPRLILLAEHTGIRLEFLPGYGE